MDDRGCHWFRELRSFAAKRKEKTPHTGLEELSDTEQAKAHVIAGEVRDWLRNGLPHFARQRFAFQAMHDLSMDPVVVFTSNATGFAAAESLFEEPPQEVVWLLDDEFSAFKDLVPDPDYRWHIHFWSRFSDDFTANELHALRRSHPLPANASYTRHREGTMFGPNGGRGMDHLWCYDREKLRLLEEAFTEWTA